MDSAELAALYEQAIALREQGNYRDALALYEMALQRCGADDRFGVRFQLAITILMSGQAYTGTEQWRGAAERNYLRIKQEVQAGIDEDIRCWPIQSVAVMSAQELLYNYTGPSGIVAWFATSGGTSKLAKESEETYQRLTNEMLLLGKLGEQCLMDSGYVTDFAMYTGGNAVLDAMGAFEEVGKPPPTRALGFFLQVSDSQIKYGEGEQNLAGEIPNLRRLMEARRIRR